VSSTVVSTILWLWLCTCSIPSFTSSSTGYTTFLPFTPLRPITINYHIEEKTKYTLFGSLKRKFSDVLHDINFFLIVAKK
jgi:hypothetical protein